MEPIIKVEGLNKEFKVLTHHEGIKGRIKDLFSREHTIKKVVKDISFDIAKGEIVGYLGPNGAGKSTTIKMMTGVLKPTSGSIRVSGLDPYANRVSTAQRIGVVFGQRSQLWWSLPVIESFKILKEIYRIPTDKYEHKMKFYDSVVKVSELYDKPVRQLSLGQRTLCDILAAFLHDPEVVFLDEPTIGLDVAMKHKIRNLIKLINKEFGTTVIITTHDMGDVDAICERIIIIDEGSCIYDDSIENLKKFFGNIRILKVRFSDDKEEMEADKEQLSRMLDEFRVFINDDFINIMVDEDICGVSSVLDRIRDYKNMKDIHIEEASTESIIKKIYDSHDK